MRKITRFGVGAIAAIGIAILGLSAASAVPERRRTPPMCPTIRLRCSRSRSTSVGQNLFVPITPCRVVDTRGAVGPFSSGQTRTYYVAGTSGFAPQGGHSGGCGIPAGAVAVTASLSAVSPVHAGFFRAWAYGGAEPQARPLLNYSTVNITTGATVPLNPGTGQEPDRQELRRSVRSCHRHHRLLRKADLWHLHRHRLAVQRKRNPHGVQPRQHRFLCGPVGQ